MKFNSFEKIIDKAWENRDQINSKSEKKIIKTIAY